jgi:hypothetical protein
VLAELPGPLRGRTQRRGVQAAEVLATDHPSTHERGALEHAHVLRRRRKVIASGAASSLRLRSPSASCRTIARRAGCASAWKT